MSATLPPGWAEWVGFQRLDIGRYRVVVSTAPVPSSWWTVRTGTSNELASGYAPSVPEARRAGLTALQTLLNTAVAEVDAALSALNSTESA